MTAGGTVEEVDPDDDDVAASCAVPATSVHAAALGFRVAGRLSQWSLALGA